MARRWGIVKWTMFLRRSNYEPGLWAYRRRTDRTDRHRRRRHLRIAFHLRYLYQESSARARKRRRRRRSLIREYFPILFLYDNEKILRRNKLSDSELDRFSFAFVGVSLPPTACPLSFMWNFSKCRVFSAKDFVWRRIWSWSSSPPQCATYTVEARWRKDTC